MALFLERAQAADPGFALTEQNASAIIEICRRLDGIPLALELAASRARAIDVTEIASRLDERFRLLKGIRRGADPRHRTLQDAIGWSYELLDDDEKRLFASLAVFAGQFDLAAAESISDGDDDVLDVLTRLTERSMLVVRRSAAGGTRYEMLETLREYGRSRLDDDRSVTLYSTHARQFASAAAAIEAGLDSADEGVAVARERLVPRIFARRNGSRWRSGTSTLPSGWHVRCASTGCARSTTRCSPGPMRCPTCRAAPSTLHTPSC